MIVFVNNEEFIFEVKTFLEVYYPNEKIKFISKPEINCDYIILIENELLSVTYFENSQLKYKSEITNEQLNSMNLPQEWLEKRKQLKLLIKQLIFNVEEKKGNRGPWGILTGIRPTKIVFKLMKQLGDIQLVKNELFNKYKISQDKINLMIEVAGREKEILKKNRENEINLYIGIPFCPTRCLYCSFTSYPITMYKDYVDDYLKSLIKELEYCAGEMLKGKLIRSLYIGGGTPTSLDLHELEVLLKSIHKYIDINNIMEFTVEAGRPDTITIEKLKLLKQYKVNRISINPQTMHDKTLKLIGRNHSVKDTVNAFDMANSIGFETINADIIIGLPGEGVSEIIHTMKFMKELAPNNLTVHTMAVKRGSKLIEHMGDYSIVTAETIENMIEISSEGAYEIGLRPYYLYRQKHMVGNFENVGYSKLGHECTYNVEIMEEKQPIIALGAGAVTKFVNGAKINRVENVKNVNEYINRIDEMIKRKAEYIC